MNNSSKDCFILIKVSPALKMYLAQTTQPIGIEVVSDDKSSYRVSTNYN